MGGACSANNGKDEERISSIRNRIGVVPNSPIDDDHSAIHRSASIVIESGALQNNDTRVVSAVESRSTTQVTEEHSPERDRSLDPRQKATRANGAGSMPTDAKSRRRTGEKDRPDGLVPDDARMHPKKTGIRYATLIQNIEQIYEIRGLLGQGAQAAVYHGVRRSDKQDHALKSIFDADQMTHKMKRQLETEIKILNRINHQCVVDLKDVFEDRDPVIYIVMDILSGPELYDLISENGPFSERESAKVMYQLLSALEYLHKKRVAHRDIKLENIVFSSKHPGSRVVLIDFGLAAILPEPPQNFFTNICGTSMYLAPEVLTQSSPGKSKGYDLRADAWSVGIVMHAMLTGYFPFDKDPPELYDEIRSGRYDTTEHPWEFISESARDCLDSLLTVDAKRRATPTQALHHQWIRDYDNNNPVPPGGSEIQENTTASWDQWMGGALDRAPSWNNFSPTHEAQDSSIISEVSTSRPTTKVDGSDKTTRMTWSSGNTENDNPETTIEVEPPVTPSGISVGRPMTGMTVSLHESTHSSDTPGDRNKSANNTQMTMESMTGFSTDEGDGSPAVRPMRAPGSDDEDYRAANAARHAKDSKAGTDLSPMERTARLAADLEDEYEVTEEALHKKKLHARAKASMSCPREPIRRHKDREANSEGPNSTAMNKANKHSRRSNRFSQRSMGGDPETGSVGRLVVRRKWEKGLEEQHKPPGAKGIGGVYAGLSRYDAIDVKPAYSQLTAGEGGTTLKFIEDTEDIAYESFKKEKVMKQFLPRYLGVKVIEGDRYLELESLQSHFDPATSITIAIKMGFKTFRPDAKRMDIPKKMYYIKARKHCEHLLTPAEHAAREVTQARWLSMKDDETSSSTAGFCIDGVRIKHEIVPLDSLSRTTSVFDSILRRGGVTKELLALVVAELRELRECLVASDLFMKHHLYNSNILVIMDLAPDAPTKVMVKMVDIGGLVARHELVTHAVTADQLPLSHTDPEDGYLTGLMNLMRFLDTYEVMPLELDDEGSTWGPKSPRGRRSLSRESALTVSGHEDAMEELRGRRTSGYSTMTRSSTCSQESLDALIEDVESENVSRLSMSPRPPLTGC